MVCVGLALFVTGTCYLRSALTASICDLFLNYSALSALIGEESRLPKAGFLIECRNPYRCCCGYNITLEDWLKFFETNIRAVYTRENKPRLTLATAYIIRERNYLYEYILPGQDKPRLEKAVNVDFVSFIRVVRVSCKPRPE